MNGPEIVSRRSPSRVSLVYSLFFLSGVAGLVYEASWSRQIGLVVGNTAQAAALVLAAYFSGLAIGQFFGGRFAAHVPTLPGYGIAELSSAIWACLVPSLLDWVGAASGQNNWNLFRDSSAGQATWCFLLLLPATMPLGATFPFVAENLRADDGSRCRGSIAYGVNTAGGLVGILATSTFLMVAVGVRGSGFLAAVISAGCGLTACVASTIRRDRSKLGITYTVASEKDDGARIWKILAAISGFGILGIEVLYTRMFALIFHNSTYTFVTVVAVFLLALSIGAALTAWLGNRFTPRRIATASFCLGGLGLAVSVISFPWLTGLGYFSFGETFAEYLTGAFCLIAFYAFPPVMLLGMALPAAIQAASGGRSIGFLTAANSLACAAGAVTSGFLLPPNLGLWSSFAVFVVLFGGTGMVLLINSGSRGHASALALVVMGLTAVIVAGPLSDRLEIDGDELVRRWESAYGWVDVVRSRDGGLAVRQNLHYRHGSTAYAMREYRQGVLPLLLHPTPTDVAFLGLGTGLTAAPAVVDDRVKNAAVIELIPEVVEAARLLSRSNFGVVDHPKVEVRSTDARYYLRHTARRFDVIVSDLFVPWESRTGYLYSVEFYATARQRLKPRGLICQWLALYQLGDEQFEMIADSFASVFPHTTIWWGRFDPKQPIVALVGSEEPITLDVESLEDRIAAWNSSPVGVDPELQKPSDLAGHFLGKWSRNPARKLNTDEHPWLEFAAPISHRAGRTLSGSSLRRYFDLVFSRLPSDGVRAGGKLNIVIQDPKRRRALQRLSLFGE